MPTMELTGDNWDWLRVFSYASFPNEPEKRHRLCVLTITKIAADLGESIDLTADQLSILLNGARFPEIESEAVKTAMHGAAAGDLLMHVWGMSQANMAEPSLKKAVHLEAERRRNLRKEELANWPASEKYLRDSWREYQAVAHLWAAWSAIEQSSTLHEAAPTPFGRDLLMLLSLSEHLADFATNFIPLRTRPRRSIILDPWRVPPGYVLPKHDYAHDGVPARFDAILSGYFNPNRYSTL